MTILETHNLFNLVIDKVKNTFWSHEDVDNFLHMSQMEVFATLIGNYQKYSRRSSPPVGAGETTRINSELAPFKEEITYLTMPFDPTTANYGVTDGVLALPADFQMMDAVVSISTAGGRTRERPVQEVDGEEWARRADSGLIVPNKISAIYRWKGKGGTLNNNSVGERLLLEFRPKDISGRVFYYRRPRKPNYVYTLNGRVETHDPNASQNLEWSDAATINIIIRALQLAGVPQADVQLQSAMNLNKNADE